MDILSITKENKWLNSKYNFKNHYLKGGIPDIES